MGKMFYHHPPPPDKYDPTLRSRQIEIRAAEMREAQASLIDGTFGKDLADIIDSKRSALNSSIPEVACHSSITCHCPGTKALSCANLIHRVQALFSSPATVFNAIALTRSNLQPRGGGLFVRSCNSSIRRGKPPGGVPMLCAVGRVVPRRNWGAQNRPAKGGACTLLLCSLLLNKLLPLYWIGYC